MELLSLVVGGAPAIPQTIIISNIRKVLLYAHTHKKCKKIQKKRDLVHALVCSCQLKLWFNENALSVCSGSVCLSISWWELISDIDLSLSVPTVYKVVS